MANDLRNLTVRLSLDRLNFDQGLSSVNRALNTLRGELTSTNSGMGGFASESDRLRSRADVLSRTIQVQEERVRLLRQSYEQAVQATGENSRASQVYAAQVNSATAQLQRMQGQLTQTTEQMNRLNNQSTSFSDRMATMGNRLQDAGMKIGMVFGSISLAVGGALKEAISKGAEFEAEMAKVGSKAGASSDELKKLSDAAMQFAPLAGGATNAATAMDDLAAKGYSVEQIMTAMPGILSAANASGEDLALTSDTITSALEAFHMKATDTSHVADVLAMTSNKTAAGMQDLQYTFKYAAAPAAQLGVSLEQLSAATGILANNGIKGEQAGTSLRSAMLRLVDPPKEAANALNTLNVKTTDASGNFVGLDGVIGQLNKSMVNMTDAQKAATLSQIFGTEAVSALMVLVSSGKDKMDEFTSSIKNSDGASAAAASQMQDNFAGSLRKLNGAMDAAKIGIEQALAPALRGITEKIQGIVTAFNNLSPGMKQFIAVGLAVTAAITTIAASAGVLLAGLGALGVSFGGVLLPITLAIGGLGLLATAVMAVRENINQSKQANLDQAQSLIDQKKSLDDLTNSYTGLKDKCKLSNDELLQFRDIQTQLKTAKSAEEIKALSDEAEQLRQKSGLSNDQLNQMLTLNDQIIKKTPDIKQSFSDRGNAIIQSKDALDQVNSRLSENIRLELENQKIKAEANLTNNIQKYIQALDEAKAKEKERDAALKAAQDTEKRFNDLKIQAQQQVNEGKTKEAEETIKQAGQEGALLDRQRARVSVLSDEVTQKQNTVNQTQQEIQKTQELYDKMINLQLAQVGINQTGAEGVAQLDQAIQKSQERVNQLNTAKQSQGGLNAEQQTELSNLQQALGHYQNAKSEIQKIQGEQQSVNQRIDEGTGKADNMNKSLGKNVDKKVNINDNGQVDSVNERISREATKNVRINAIWDGAKAVLQALKIPGFAVGTDNAPGGWSLVGEQGPELMYVPKGSRIIPNNLTNKILGKNTSNNSAIPTADSTQPNRNIDVKVYTQSVNMDEYELGRTLQRMEALYGR